MSSGIGELIAAQVSLNALTDRQLATQKGKTKQACLLAESMLQYLINNNDIEVETAVKYKMKLQELKS